MTDAKIRRRWPWPALLAFGLLWGVVIRQFSPHWSLFAQYNYGWGVPFLCLYLFGERWLTRPEPEITRSTALTWVGVFVAAIILLLTRVVQEANTTWRPCSWAMAMAAVWISLCGIYLKGGKSWLRHFLFPVAFFLVAVPWPSAFESLVIQNLTRLNVAATVEALTLHNIPALPRGNVIEIGAGLVGIDEACSGVRSLQATLMISLFFGEWYRLPARRRIGLVAAGAGLAFVFNVARTFLLVSVAARDGIPAIAKWHDPAGVTILLACFSALWAVAFLLQKNSAPPSIVKQTASTPRPLPVFFVAGLSGWMMLTELGTELWYRAHESTTLTSVQWSVRWPLQKNEFGFKAIDKEVHEIMNFDDGQAAHWRNDDGTMWYGFYFRWLPARSLAQRVKIQAAKGHRPDICLRASGMTLREEYPLELLQVGNLRFPFRCYRFEDRGTMLYVFYSAWEDGANGNPSANLREDTGAKLAAAWAGTRGLGERMLEFIISGAADEAKAKAILRNELPALITTQ